MQNISIVYLAAGISSRFQGKIKQLAKIGKNQETLIELSLAQAVKAGFSNIIIILGNKTEKPIKQVLGSNFQGVPISYALQTYNSSRDKPWGTTDALCAAKSLIKSGFVVCNGDDLYGAETLKVLADHLKISKEEATIGYKLINTLPEQGLVNRGIFKVEDNYATDIKETFNIEKSNLAATSNSPDDLCSMNLFALHPNILNLLCSKLEKFKTEHKADRKIEALLPAGLASLIKQEKIKMKIYPAKNIWLGLTNPEDEEILRNKLAT